MIGLECGVVCCVCAHNYTLIAREPKWIDFKKLRMLYLYCWQELWAQLVFEPDKTNLEDASLVLKKKQKMPHLQVTNLKPKHCIVFFPLP